jgi:hypothetical protein
VYCHHHQHHHHHHHYPLSCSFSQVKALYSSKLVGSNVVVLVPVPDNTSKAKLLVTAGKAKYDATKKALVWKVCCRGWWDCRPYFAYSTQQC